MKVKELIKHLEEVDQLLEVKFFRMDWGYCDIKQVETSRGFADLLTFSARERIEQKK